MNTQKPELLPCPFCGNDNISLFPPTCRENDVYDPNGRAFPIARCYGCFAEAAGDNWDHTPGSLSAITAWNTRADGWQPIESAPKDGKTRVVVGMETTDGWWEITAVLYPDDGDSLTQYNSLMYYNGVVLAHCFGKELTHWKPVQPPKVDE